MVETMHFVGVILALLGGAGIFASLVGPQYPLMATTAPSLDATWRTARKWGAVLLIAGVAIFVLSLVV